MNVQQNSTFATRFRFVIRCYTYFQFNIALKGIYIFLSMITLKRHHIKKDIQCTEVLILVKLRQEYINDTLN